jgi:hypothetical protein
VTISHPIIDLAEVEPDWPDEVVDLTDRRRLLVLAVLGQEVTPAQADALFEPRPQPSSTTMRSDGRSSSTDDR